MTANQKIFGGIGLLVVGYLAYKHYKKEGSVFKSDTDDKVIDSNMSNATGSFCRCDNGVSGRCASGNCSKCCGGYNKAVFQKDTRVFKF